MDTMTNDELERWASEQGGWLKRAAAIRELIARREADHIADARKMVESPLPEPPKARGE